MRAVGGWRGGDGVVGWRWGGGMAELGMVGMGDFGWGMRRSRERARSDSCSVPVGILDGRVLLCWLQRQRGSCVASFGQVRPGLCVPFASARDLSVGVAFCFLHILLFYSSGRMHFIVVMCVVAWT